VHADRTAYTNRDLDRVVEPGEIEVLAGTSAADLPLSGTVTLTGPLRTVGHDRRLDTPVELVPLGPGVAGPRGVSGA
jgi:beta-xylosidase